MSDDNDFDDPRTPADKDSTGKNHNKKNEKSYNAASLTPMGSVAVRSNQQVVITMHQETPKERKMTVNLDRMDINHEEKMLGVTVLLHINEGGPTPDGIKGGRITRMTLTKGDIGKEDILAHFDKGEWIQKPSGALATQVMMRAMKQENGLEMPEVKPAFDHTNKHKIRP